MTIAASARTRSTCIARRNATWSLGRDGLVGDLRTGTDYAEVRGGVGEERPDSHRRLCLSAFPKGVRVASEEVAERSEIFSARGTHVDLRALRESVAERRIIEAAVGIVPQIDGPTAHARADPAAGIAEHDRGPAGHVLEREAAQVPAEDDLGAREADRGTRVRSTLHEKTAALCAVREALPHRAVDEVAEGVARFEDRDGSAERGLRAAILRAAADGERDPVARVCGEPVPRDRTLGERRRDRRGRRPGDTNAR